MSMSLLQSRPVAGVRSLQSVLATSTCAAVAVYIVLYQPRKLQLDRSHEDRRLQRAGLCDLQLCAVSIILYYTLKSHLMVEGSKNSPGISCIFQMAAVSWPWLLNNSTVSVDIFVSILELHLTGGVLADD